MFCGGTQEDEKKRKSRQLDAQLKTEAKRLSRVIQLLLLGTGESGKTTIIKQMKIIHIDGFSQTERQEKIPNVRQNIHESIFTLVSNMSRISPPTRLEHSAAGASAEYILSLGPDAPTEFTDEYYDHVNVLWSDGGVRETFERSNEFQLIDSAKHFLDRIEEIRREGYVPSVQDMLFCRVTTVAISKIQFKINYKGEKVEFWMYDVGGQRGERKKWISVFEGIHAILFLIAASDFDQTLREDEKGNRLKEAFKVFADIFWSRFVRKSGKIVFLNKQDLLRQKIANGRRLDVCFPDFATYAAADKRADAADEYERAKLYMRDKIIGIANDRPQSETVDLMPGRAVEVSVRSQAVYIHFTVATDTNNVKLVFDSVKDMILVKNIQDAGLN